VARGTALDRARDALTRHEWATAYEAFGDVDRTVMTGADLEGFADAAWWTSHLPESIRLRTEAYAAYDAEGDDARAAAVAGRLAIEHAIRRETTVSGGFMMRAQRHLAELPATPPGVEHGFMAVLDATLATFGGDPEAGVRRAGDAVAIARSVGDPELRALAVHTEGIATIAAGRVPEGIALLDEAMAGIVAGEVGPYFTGIIYCSVISACLELSDIRRAGDWSDAARAWCATIPPDSPYPGMCRANRAEIARLRGSWPEAEAEAERACDELMHVEPAIAAAAFLQLAEVRRRRGDLAGADEAYERAHEFGEDPQPGYALLRFAQGKRAAARAALATALAVPARPAHRVRLLAAQVEVALADGDVDDARGAAEELTAIAAGAGTGAFTAQAEMASGAVALAAGDAAAVPHLRAATAAWNELRLPYETASARVLFGQALRRAGDEEGGRRELRAALASFERLGAVADAANIAARLGDREALPAGLTAREVEILRLVAAGKTNRDIAVELVISEHTVSRHLQNMYAKLGVSSRAKATAFAFEHDLT
jgi:DNA-binding CsgD family transcriptional regulator